METYQLRVIKEKKALDEKIKKLTAFILAEKVTSGKKVPEAEMALLGKQLIAMNEYSDILAERIKTFLESPILREMN